MFQRISNRLNDLFIHFRAYAGKTHLYLFPLFVGRIPCNPLEPSEGSFKGKHPDSCNPLLEILIYFDQIFKFLFNFSTIGIHVS